MFYSKSTGGFYTTEIHGDNIPADAVAITVEEHAALLNGQSQGKRIVADADGFPVLADPLPPTAAQIRVAAKDARAVAVAAITVTTASGKTFNGDETSQDRMARAILALQAVSAASTLWVLANNTPATVTVAELGEALALAGAAQSAIWVIP